MGNVSSMIERRSELYHALAEALADTPSWMLLPGQEWPLTKAVTRLTDHSDAARNALNALARVPIESEATRRARYKRLFSGPGQPRFWLYESMWRNGRFLGPEMIDLERLYRVVGLEVVGAEAADHVSIELAFLAHLAERQAAEPSLAPKWKQLERLFIKKHAGQWLPALGRSLAASGDEVYGPIGALVADWILESQLPGQRQGKQNSKIHRPFIGRKELCTLCGFCVQVCPTGVLKIHETAHDTMLRVTASPCNGCRKCVTACPSEVLTVRRIDSEFSLLNESVVLRRSPRVYCPGCREATVSQAELDFVAEELGQPEWLPYCLPCRSELIKEMR
jgi:TorA maturation chaperone TorD/ferredoxin